MRGNSLLSCNHRALGCSVSDSAELRNLVGNSLGLVGFLLPLLFEASEFEPAGVGDANDIIAESSHKMWFMRDMRYGRIVDGKVMGVPVRAQDTVQKFVDDGVLAGVGDGKLDLTMDMLRTLVIAANAANVDK